MGTLWNTYAFFVLYAEIDGFDATAYTLEREKTTVMDRWILSRLHSVVKEVDDDLGNYRIPEAARALDGFVDDLSNWYVRRCRERFWAKGMKSDKITAYMTLYTALVTIVKAAAPMIPFMTEEIYQNLVRSIDPSAPESVHLCDFPEADASWIDPELEEDMAQLLKIVVMGRACRNASNIKNRQPLERMYVRAQKELPPYFAEIAADELNVRHVEFTDDVSAFTTYTFKPQLRTVGPKYGSRLAEIKKALEELDGNAAMARLESDGVLKLAKELSDVELAKDDLLITMTQTEGYVTEGDQNTTVVMDTRLTPELLEEGFVREVISKIQTMRKEAGFNVTDRIRVSYQGSGKVRDIFTKNYDTIAKEVLADAISEDAGGAYQKEWDLNGEKVALGVTRQ